MSELTLEELSLIKVSELRNYLNTKGIKSSGNKYLVERLKLIYEKNRVDDGDNENEVDENQNDETDKDEDDSNEEHWNQKIESDSNCIKTRKPNESTTNFTKLVSSTTFVSFKGIEESASIFFVDDKTMSVISWLDEFNDLSELCRLSDIQKVIYAKRLLKGSAATYINRAKNVTTCLAMAKALKVEFSSQVWSKKVHQELMNRKKLPDETYK